ncbi:TonB-dependent receptor [Chryseobacterium sp. MFBS3-17]|uniref:TonB-dependent receptor n=1 Tax=Chryseobacterium sp. MFBS3-17 TaxID=2886689 RepID=UPI001D0EE055|nr:TonB-dependent receptor [Chryseobacterium sp. MFBS3-17]MCC2591101.1 TonB-dependent receptor [Chryseobacterium sp. MFBS3-17]
MKSIFSILMMLCGFIIIPAQTFQVKGIVYDFHDRSPLANAQIQLGNVQAVSAADGSFNLAHVPAGTYGLQVTHPECEPFRREVQVNRDLFLTINLEHHYDEIQEVVLHGGHQSTGSVVVRTLEQDEIQRNATENLGNILSSLSGVGTLKTGNNVAKPIIHGLYGSRISILNNGAKMAEQEWGVEHAPNVDVTAFDHVDVIKGASALKYGAESAGGVILLQPETFRKTDTLKGRINLAGISNGRGAAMDAQLTRTWENSWYLSAQGSYKKLGDLRTPDYYLWNTGAESHAFSFRTGKSDFMQGFQLYYALTQQEAGIFRGSHIGNLEDFEQVMASGKPVYVRDFSYDIDHPKQEVSHHLAKASWYKRFEKAGKISAEYSFQYNQRKEYDIRRESYSGLPVLDLELFTNQFHLNHLLERTLWNLESGADLAYQYNYSSAETMARRLVPNYHKYSGGLFSVFKYHVLPELRAEAGLRYDRTHYTVKMWYDHHDWEHGYGEFFPEFFQYETEGGRVFTIPKLNFDNLSYNAGLNYNPGNHLDVKLNYTRSSRTPNIAELFSDGLHHSAAVIEKGDLMLQNEVSHQVNLEVASKFDVLEGLSVSVNPYYLHSDHFINQVPTGIQNTIRGIFPVWTYEQIKATMWGVDVDLALQVTDKWSYKGNFAYVHGTDRSHNQPLMLMQPANFVNALEFRNPERNKLFLRLWNQTFLSQNRYPLYNPVLWTHENHQDVARELDLSTPPAGYSLWNVQAGVQISRNWSAGLTLHNIFDTRYRDYLNRMRYFADESGRNMIFNLTFQF